MDKAGKYGIMGCVTKNIAANAFRECKRLPELRGKVRRPAVALQTEKKEGWMRL